MNKYCILVLSCLLFYCCMQKTADHDKNGAHTGVIRDDSENVQIRKNTRNTVINKLDSANKISISDFYYTLISMDDSLLYGSQSLIDNKKIINDIIRIMNTIDRYSYIFEKDTSYCGFSKMESLRKKAILYRKHFYEQEDDFFSKIMSSYKHTIDRSTHSVYFEGLEVICSPWLDEELYSYTLKCD